MKPQVAASAPRTRGAVPRQQQFDDREAYCSPHARGCSRARGATGRGRRLLPARAGLFPTAEPRPAAAAAAPRTRGAVPHWAPRPDKSIMLLPARAGLFPRRTRCRPRAAAPRTRGAVPCSAGRVDAGEDCSPHARGCSQQLPCVPPVPALLPARAGLFPATSSRPRTARSAPRTRGAVPQLCELVQAVTGCSPHARGCSQQAADGGLRPALLPARAGLFPTGGPGLP